MIGADDPVFPGPIDPERALTKRELFAALAMMNIQNVALRKSGRDYMADLIEKHNTLGLPRGVKKAVALEAVEQADELIAALEGR